VNFSTIVNYLEIARFEAGLFGAQLGVVSTENLVSKINNGNPIESLFNGLFTNSYSGVSTTTITKQIANNLGLILGANTLTSTNINLATNFIQNQLDVSPIQSRGAAVKNILDLWSSLENDNTNLGTIFGPAAKAWNQTISSAIEYGSGLNPDTSFTVKDLNTVVTGSLFTTSSPTPITPSPTPTSPSPTPITPSPTPISSLQITKITPPDGTRSSSTSDITFLFSENIKLGPGNITITEPNGVQDVINVLTPNNAVKYSGNGYIFLVNNSTMFQNPGIYKINIPGNIIFGFSSGAPFAGINYSIGLIGVAGSTDGGGGGGGGGGGE
jgi:hypothetical protein